MMQKLLTVKKPEIIIDYNASKGSVDTLDQCVHEYSCSRQTSRWPNKLFFNIIDVGALNAYICFKSLFPDWKQGQLFKRRLFLLDLSRALTSEHMERRARCPNLPLPIQHALSQQGFQRQTIEQSEVPRIESRGRCYDCRKQVRVKCSKCPNFVCKEHSQRQNLCSIVLNLTVSISIQSKITGDV
jgi:hypothetical protein